MTSAITINAITNDSLLHGTKCTHIHTHISAVDFQLAVLCRAELSFFDGNVAFGIYFVAGNPDYFGPVSASVVRLIWTNALGFGRPEEVVDSNEDFRNWVRDFRKSRSEQQRIEWELKRKELHNLENGNE
ncbi:hypothetical protein Tsp_05596 [Trichinella spiralis]|uniref:hypothetical protein n=1 Tax=Trichinella spiralis TaxID=6334 RepID=UPI0001EFE18D|nr:hypothetical protein Tsp_05596 [Trichinella spiralis]